MEKRNNVRLLLRNLLMIAVGSAIFSLGFDLFLEPAGISCGGVSGIAMLVIYAAQPKFLTVGILSAIINLPLFFFGYRKIGKLFFFGSLLGMVVTSVGFDLFARILPIPKTEPLVAAIFGGVIIGAGLGIVFIAGGLLMFIPGTLTDITGLVIAAALLLVNVKKWEKGPKFIMDKHKAKQEQK